MEKKGKLELTWVGKYEEEKLEPRILIEDKSKSYGESNTENMLIHGDNLLALKALENKYTGMIKCIYIDPPYNTGAAFEHYDDNLEHSIWLGIMKKRLEILRNLLAEDGTIWIEVVDQYLALIEGTDEEKKKIVRRYATVIVEDLRKQIYASKEESTEFVFNVQKDLIVFKSFAKNMKENGRLNFKKEVPDKKNIKQYLFEGYKKSYYAENAFDSDDERRLSVVLEEDSEVIRFIKPPLNQLGLFYKAAKQYNPDFLVETADKKYMIEVKAANQTDNEDVQEKAKAAIKWCECASQVDADGKTWEYRLVPGDKIIVGNTFKYVIGMAIPVVVDGE